MCQTRKALIAGSSLRETLTGQSKGRSSEQKAPPVGNSNELPNFNKAGIKVITEEQKSCQEDVHRLARGNSKRKVRFGLVVFFFTSQQLIPASEMYIK